MPTTHTVEIKDNFYDPKEITVKVEDTVEWVHKGTSKHNVISDDGETFASPDLPQGSPPFKYTFDKVKPGEFPYTCTFHPTEMFGKIIVTAR